MAKPTARPLAMLTILGVLALPGAAAIGCGDANKAPAPDSASSAPTPSPTSMPQGAGAPTPSPTTSNTAPPIKAEQSPPPGGAASGAAPGPGGPYERASLLAYLPAECPEGRAYVDVQKMLGGDGGAVKDLIEKLVSTSSKDKAKGEAVLAELRKGGLDPAVSVREIAACVLAGRQPLVVFGIDTSKAKDATQTLFEAISAGEGKDKVTLVDEGGMKVIKNPRGELMAMVAPNVLVLAKSVDRLKEAAKAPGGTAGFADAPAHVLWMRLRGREDVDVSVAEKGKDYEMTALFPPSGPMVAKIASDPKGVVEAYESEAQKRAKQIEGSPLKTLASAVKAAKWSVDGDRVKVAANAPQSVVVETIKVVLSTPEQQLMGAFR